MVAGMLRILAAAATPCAWLPDENATTPPLRASSGIDDSLLKAPRNLNEPVRCRLSGFRNTLAPPGAEPIHARRPDTGNAATGVPLARASNSTRPNVSVLDGNTKTSAAA